MKKNVFGRQFKRDFNERKALFKSLMTALVLEERIQTTEEKAKAIRGSVEKLVTKAKKRGEEARQFLLPHLHEDAVQKMIADIAPRFSSRPGGYTRIMKLGKRFNDNASMVLIEWVERNITEVKTKGKKKQKKAETVEKTTSVTKPEKKAKTGEAKPKTKKSTAKKPNKEESK